MGGLNMTDLNDLERRVQKLEAQIEIRELATAYAVACDEHDMDRLVSLFTEDACFDSPSGLMMANGRQAINDMFIEMFKIRGPGYHWTHDVFVRVDDTDLNHATGTVLSHAETCPADTVSLAAMKYNDVYRREGGVWRFAKREINFLYYVPVTDYHKSLTSQQRFYAGGEWRDADYPEKLPVWKAFDATHKS
jgi:uncharacterized protein (TIGR02246 family)